MLDWLEHNTLLSVVVFYVVFNQFISQSCLRVLVITPHVQFMKARISHSFTHESNFAFIALTIIATHRCDTDLVALILFQSLKRHIVCFALKVKRTLNIHPVSSDGTVVGERRLPF